MAHSVRIPYFSSCKIISQKEVGVFSVWLSLKTVYRNSCINNWTSRIKELSTHTGMCRKSVSGYVKKLIEGGWATVKDGVLKLSSYNSLAERYGLKMFGKKLLGKFYKITTVKQIKLELRRQVIYDLQLIQKIAVEKKEKVALKNIATSEARRRSKVRRLCNEQSFSKVLDSCKTSQKKIASQMGLKFHSSGKYWSDKLEAEKLISVRRNKSIPVMKGNNKMLSVLRETTNSSLFISRTGIIFKRICNDICTYGK